MNVFMDLHCDQQQEVLESISSAEKEKKSLMSNIMDICQHWELVQTSVEKHHPNKAVALRAVILFNDNEMSYFCEILKRRQKMEAKESVFRRQLVDIQGVPMFWSIAEEWGQVEAFQARPDDLLIATYPKSGTTWASEIVDMIYNDGNVEQCKRDAIFNRVPFMELIIPGMSNGVEQLNKMPSPRLVKTHLPVQLLPESFEKNNCKIIYVARNGKDVAVSYYHFYQMAKMHPEPENWDEFLEKFVEGKVAFGSWYDHVKGWWEKRKNLPIMYLFYEDMKEDPKCELQRMLQFLEKEVSEETFHRILHHTSFQEMKNNPTSNYKMIPIAAMDHSVSPFMRKGISGDWKNHFTVAQNERFDEDYAEKMKGSTLAFRMEIREENKPEKT